MIQILLLIFTVLFPVFSLFINILILFLSKKIKIGDLRFLLFNLGYSLAMIAYLYHRVSETGDVYQYSLMLENTKFNKFEFNFFTDYDDWYYSWYTLLNIVSVFDGSIFIVNFISIFLIYGCLFYILLQLYAKKENYFVFKLVLFKMLTLISIITLVSSYRNTLAFSLLFFSVTLFLQKGGAIKKFLSLFCVVLGIGFHPSAWLIVLSFIVSLFVSFKRIYLVFSIAISWVVFNFLLRFFSTGFVFDKIDTYTTGDFLDFTVGQGLIYFILLGMGIFISFLYISIINNYHIIDYLDKFMIKFQNFILIYFIFALIFLHSKVMADRFLYSAGAFVLMFLGYYVFLNYKKYKNNYVYIALMILWLGYIDTQLLYVMQKSYVIGDGFPYVLAYSPLWSLIK